MKYIFIIDTDAYAGNFEREMTAYMTGEVGECCVGHEGAAQFEEDVHSSDETCGWAPYFEENIMQEPDEHGCHRPCSLWSSPDSKPNSVAIFLEEEPTKETVDFLKDRANKWLTFDGKRFPDQSPSEIFGFRLWSEEIVTKEVWAY